MAFSFVTLPATVALIVCAWLPGTRRYARERKAAAVPTAAPPAPPGHGYGHPPP
ncbi:hypothetical protein [Streptomyces spectabilis]|uniref:hypothetical protein n=1 Tax=Streptomyces spectabilis TaxID=68270 RepID=UPI00137785CC|nr:hypothetical protein [Streptomyces spectabilis]